MWARAALSGQQSNRRFHFLAAERHLLLAVALIGAVAVVLTQILQRHVVWQPFLAGYAATLGLAVIGAYLRQKMAAPRLALGLIGVAIYAGFIAVSLIFIFTLLPLPRPLIDPTLIALDAALGYHWPGLVAWLADHPGISRLLSFVYQSSQLQLLLTIAILAFTAKSVALHRFLAVGILTMMVAVTIWWIAPSIGPSAFFEIPEADLAATGLLYTPSSGAYLRHLIEVGPPRLSPEVFIGIIAFPSYHIIMACLAVWFTRGTMAFVPLAIANTAMIPATLSHGGHHLVDLLAGVLVFAAAVALINRLIRHADPSDAA